MATLTADELVDVRLVTGIASDTTVISDTVIQAQYALAYVDAPDSTLIMPYTYVYVLRRLWGAQRKKADRTTDHGDRQTRSQVTDNTKAILDYWEGVAGLGDGEGGRLATIGVGTLALGIDATEDNESEWDGSEE